MNIKKTMLFPLAAMCFHIAANENLKPKKDFTHKQSGIIKHEFIAQENPAFLNASLPDKYKYTKVTIELKHHMTSGKKEFGHNALEAFINLRHKSIWGTAGRTDISSFPGLKVGSAYLGSDTTLNSTKPINWIKEYWLKTSLNALFGMQNDALHFVKMGMFGHSLGRGIAMGSEYGSSKDFLAVYSKGNDFSAPGILLSGTVPSSSLTYKAYVGCLENKSTSLRDNLNTIRTNQVGYEQAPWSGADNYNHVYALSFNIIPIDSENIKVEFEPYIAYNRALAQTIDLQQDSESHLKTSGLNIQVSSHSGQWGIDCEFAKNFGKEKLYKIDRNIVKPVGSKGTYKHSHIQESVGGEWVAAEAYEELATELKTNRHQDGTNFAVTVNGNSKTFRSAANRMRPEYTNTFDGWMGVVDWYYKHEPIDLTMASAFGYFSGGANPHAVESDKTYRGFVALNEWYVGKYVTSAFMFDTRTIKRPLSVSQGDTVLNDTSLTDIVFNGYGATWKPKSYANKKLSVSSNALMFWKELAAYKYDSATQTISSTEFARRYKGTEFNLMASMEIMKNLTASLKTAVFLPGSYYYDIKGMPIAGDYYSQLDAADTMNLPADNVRVGTNTAFAANFSLDYRF
ncbi:hypothetical protein FJ366_01570 [Candidatus Dependentiae bacterium]|nr:hypothetical protein [Candidatus Dependentiae bacterium]